MSKSATALLHSLLDFAEDKELIEAEDRAYCLNRLLEIMGMDAPEGERPARAPSPETATSILEPLLELASAFPSCLPLPADLTDPSRVEALFAAIRTHTDHLDILINNAGAAHIGLLQDMTPEEWDRILSLNLRSAFLCCRQALPAMIHRGAGVILNISSIWGQVGASCEVAYSASKGGLDAFTRALAKETAPSHIRVNAISCGVIDTPMNGFLSAPERQALTENIGLGRYGRPEEVADLARFLCSEKASYLSGEVVALNGCFL